MAESSSDAGNDTSAKQTPRKPRGRLLARRIGGVVASVAVIILAPFLLLSENTIKSSINSWLNDCVIVFEKESIPPNRVKVTAYVSGKAPGTLPITFTAYDVLINRIRFATDVDRPDAGGFANLALHPLTNAACPGALCDELGNIPSSPKLTFQISDISPEFRYVFSVEFDHPAGQDKLGIFVQFGEGLPGGICRVEYVNPFNYLIRATKLEKFGWMLILFVFVGTLIAYFKRFGKENEP
jgi:hypothetical protein